MSLCLVENVNYFFFAANKRKDLFKFQFKTMKKQFKNVIFLMSILGIFGCCNCTTTYSDNLKRLELIADIGIDMYPDSSYFTDIRCMQVEKGKLYAFDVQRRDIAVLNKDLDSVFFVGSGGQGPHEIISAENIFVKNDTINILDRGDRSIKRFISSVFLERNNVPYCSGFKFFIDSAGSFFIPIQSTEGTFFKKDKMHEEITYYGRIERVGSEVKTVTMNGRDLLFNGDYIFTIPEALTTLEKYDARTMELIESYDLSQIDLIRKNLDHIARNNNLDDKSFFVLFRDAYLYGKDLYILCNTWEDEYRSNTLIRMEVTPTMKPVAIYKLPSDYYAAFSVTNDYIFAFDSSSGFIKRFKYD